MYVPTAIEETFNFFPLLTEVADDRDVREILITRPNLAKRRLSELKLPGETLVLAIARNGDYIIPHGNVQVELWDRLSLLGCPDELDDAYEILNA